MDGMLVEGDINDDDEGGGWVPWDTETLLCGSPPVAQGGLARGQQLLAPGAAKDPPGSEGQCGIKLQGEMPHTPSLKTEEDETSRPGPLFNNFQGEGPSVARIAACRTVASRFGQM
jgi:hypothetical protein